MLYTRHILASSRNLVVSCVTLVAGLMQECRHLHFELHRQTSNKLRSTTSSTVLLTAQRLRPGARIGTLATGQSMMMLGFKPKRY